LGVPGASWENSGKPRGASWAPFGPSGKTLRGFGGALEPSWGFLGAFQEDFGRLRVPFGRSWEPFLAPGAAYRKPVPEKPVWEVYVGALRSILNAIYRTYESLNRPSGTTNIIVLRLRAITEQKGTQ